MLQPKVGSVIAQREQKVIVRVMRRAEKRNSFRDNSLDRSAQFGTDRQVRVVVCGNFNLVRWIRCEWDHEKVFAREHRRIDQPLQRYRRKVYLSRVTGMTGQRQRGPEFPTKRKREIRLESDVADVRALRIQQQLVPGDDCQMRSCGCAGRETSGKSRRKKVERDFDLSHARWYFEVKCVHLGVIATPQNCLAPGANLQPGEIDDWASWSMFAGNPFWIDQRHWPGRDRHRHARVKEFARRFSGVDRKRDWPAGNVGFDDDDVSVEAKGGDDGKQK